jgi:hypothetical protein
MLVLSIPSHLNLPEDDDLSLEHEGGYQLIYNFQLFYMHKVGVYKQLHAKCTD